MKHTFGLCCTKRYAERAAAHADRSRTARTVLLGLLAAGVVAMSGCASIGPKPWQHDLLAEQAMQVDPYPLQSSMDDHIYFSKEASSGGRGFAGGGCGCN